MTLQNTRGLRLLSTYRKRNKAAAPKSSVHYAGERSSNPPGQSRAPDYLVYEVLPGVSKAQWPLVGRGKRLQSGDLHVSLNRALKDSILLRPMWSHLDRGHQEWNRRPDYEVFQADDNGEMIGTAGGAAWDQTGGAIFVKCCGRLPEYLILQRIRNKLSARLQSGNWGNDF